MKIAILVQEFKPPWDEGYKNIAKYLALGLIHEKTKVHVLDKDTPLRVIENYDAIINLNYLNIEKVLNIKIQRITNKKSVLIKYHMKKDFQGFTFNEVFYKLLLALHNHIVVSTQSLALSALKSFPRGSIHIIPPPIPIDYYKPVKVNKKIKIRHILNVPDEKIIITYTGRISNRRYAIYAIKKVLDSFSFNEKIYMLICLPDQYSKKLLQDILYYHIKRNRVRILTLSELPRSDIRYLYWASDILLYPVKNQEAVEPPLTVLEAMSTGLTVITYNANSLWTVIRDFKNGIIFLDTAELIEKIDALIKDITLLKSIGHSARNTIIKMFDYKKVAKRWIKTLNEILS